MLLALICVGPSSYWREKAMYRLLLSVGIFVVLVPFTLLAQEEKKPAPAATDDKEKLELKQKPVTFKRRDDSSDEELRKQLQLVQEVGFDQGGAAFLYASLGGNAARGL